MRFRCARLEHLLAAESEKLLRESNGAVSRHFDLKQILLRGIVRIKTFFRNFAVSDDYSEHVIEVVSNAGRQSPHRLHFLGLEELLLELFRLGNVVNDGQDAGLVVQLNALGSDLD